MKRMWLIIVSILVISGIRIAFIEMSEPVGMKLVEDENFDMKLLENDINPDGLSLVEKEFLTSRDWNYVDVFYDSTFVTPSAGYVDFNRHWQYQRLVNEDIEVDVEIDAKLYQADTEYLVISTFELPYQYSTDNIDLGKIMINYSSKFDVRVEHIITYEQDEEEYQLSSYLLLPDESNMYSIPPVDQVLHTTKVPLITYTYFFYFTPAETYDLTGDFYIDVDIDYFFAINQESFSENVGLNEVNLGTAYNMYAVTRKSVKYDKESE